MKTNNKLNKIIKLLNNSKIKNKRKRSKRNRTSITNHRFLIRQHFILDERYTQQNISLDMASDLGNEQIFINLSKVYQYFKIANVRIDFTPVTRQGNQPPVGYLLFVGNEDKQTDILYSSIPNLPYSKKIDNKSNRSYLFTRAGRQADFNYWYNTVTPQQDYPIKAYFKMHFEKTFSATSGYYVARVSYDIRFDKPFTSTSETKVAEEKVEIAKKEGKVIDKDEEAFNQAFDEIPSEDEEIE
jgi:hypothetical protein